MTDLTEEALPDMVATEGEIMVPAGDRLVTLPLNATRGAAIQLLSKDIPTNEFGLPVFFYRSDLLNINNYLTQHDVDQAAVGLLYNEGFPTLESGQTFWNQLPHEPHESYLLFTRYIEMAETYGIRQLDYLAVQEARDTFDVQQMYMEFYWSARSRAHDLFITAAERKKREFRIRRMENTHYEQTQRLLDQLLEKFSDDGDESWWAELNAKEAIEVLESLVKIQRLSTGLTGQHSSSTPNDGLSPGASPEQIMRHITKGAGLTTQTQDNFMGKLSALLDGDDGVQLQEAILRFNTTPEQFAPQHSTEGLS